jgi:vacuolar-type H+-ATPase subunit F/Vma7
LISNKNGDKMKIICVADEDTNLMFQLLGIESICIDSEDPDKFIEEFTKILMDKDIGLILIKERYLINQKKFFKTIKNQRLPCIVEIPDIVNPLPEDYFENFIKKYLEIPF